MLHSCTAQGTGSLLATDQPWCNVGIHLVDQAFAEERGMDFGAALDEQAKHAALAEIVQKSGERDMAISGRRQTEDLSGSHATVPSGRDERVGPDDPGRLTDPQLRIDHDAKGLA